MIIIILAAFAVLIIAMAKVTQSYLYYKHLYRPLPVARTTKLTPQEVIVRLGGGK